MKQSTFTYAGASASDDGTFSDESCTWELHEDGSALRDGVPVEVRVVRLAPGIDVFCLPRFGCPERTQNHRVNWNHQFDGPIRTPEDFDRLAEIMEESTEDLLLWVDQLHSKEILRQ